MNTTITTTILPKHGFRADVGPGAYRASCAVAKTVNRFLKRGLTAYVGFSPLIMIAGRGTDAEGLLSDDALGAIDAFDSWADVGGRTVSFSIPTECYQALQEGP